MSSKSIAKIAQVLAMSVLLAALGASAQAQSQVVGRVLLSSGDTLAVRDGREVRLQYNSPVEFKDTLRTGAASSLQVRFVDESLLSLRDNTEFAIEDYRFAAGGEPEGERAFFRLIKGGFRSVTGLIGRSRNANYRVQTQTATIGIRGTDYAARACAGDCGAGVKDGLYGTVLGISNGTNQITVSNQATPQPVTFGINQHFYVSSPNALPQPLLQPPAFVSIKPQGKSQATQQGGTGNGQETASSSSGASAESRPSSTTDAIVAVPTLPFRAVETLNTQGTLAALPPANGFGVFYPVSGSFEGLFDDKNFTATYGSQNSLIGYKSSLGAAPAGSLSGGTLVDTGSYIAPDGQTFSWGRWTGATQVTTKAGVTFSNIPVLFITGSNVQNDNKIIVGGQASYTFVGGPRPVDAGGNVGTITSSSLGINLTTQTVSYSLGMNFASIGAFGSAAFSVSGTGTKSTSPNGGEFSGSLSGSCSGGGCQSGSVSGAFDVGLAGPNGYDFAAVGGGLNSATKAGSVVFLNNYAVSGFIPGPAPSTQLTGQIAWANASAPSTANTFSLGPSQTTYSTINPNAPVAFNSGSGSTFSNGSATLAESGSIGLVDGGSMNWGRWTGATSVQIPASAFFSPGTGVPFVVGNSNATLPGSGTFTYTFAGGPNPTNTSGAVGSWGGGSLNVTFGPTQTVAVATPLTFAVGGFNFSLSGCSSGCVVTGPASVMGNMALTGLCTGSSCSTGQAATASLAGAFVGPQAGGLAVAGTAFSSGVPTVAFGGAFKR